MTQPEMMSQTYREDGWPLCPQCGEDELWSSVGQVYFGVHAEKAPLDEYFKEPFRCYLCHWYGHCVPRLVS